MTALQEPGVTGLGPGAGTAELLAELAEHLSGELRLRPLLERVLRAALELLGCADGAVSLLEDGGRTYRKEVEVGVVCDAGRSFPVDEGLSGQVLRGGAPVLVTDYADVPSGHLHAVDRDRLHAAVGVPVLHGTAAGTAAGTVLGALVVFSSDPDRRFTTADADLLALFARHAAVALTAARLHAALSERDRATAAARDREAAAARAAERTGRHLAEVVEHLAHGRPGPAEAAARCALAASRQASASSSSAVAGVRGGGPVAPAALEGALRAEADWAHRALGLPVRVVVAGAARSVDRDVADHLVLAVRSAVLRLGTGARATALRAGLVHGEDGVALLVEDDGGAGDQPDPELTELVAATERLGGTGQVTTTPGWGTHLRLHLPRSRHGGEPGATSTTGVLVVDGRPALRAGLVALLAQPGSGVKVVGEVAAAEEVVGVAGAARPHAVLVGSPRGASAAAAVEDLRASHPRLPVVLLSSLPDDVGAAELAAALVRAARTASSPGAAAAPAGTAVPTTPREREVLALLERGLSDRQIADELVITRKTVEKHVGSLLRKHGVPSRTALVAARLH
nr:GAF domain-containing protein [Quadrisphaera sp. RL12-1S]